MYKLDYNIPLRIDEEDTVYDASSNVKIFETEFNDFVVLYLAPGKVLINYSIAYLEVGLL